VAELKSLIHEAHRALLVPTPSASATLEREKVLSHPIPRRAVVAAAFATPAVFRPDPADDLARLAIVSEPPMLPPVPRSRIHAVLIKEPKYGHDSAKWVWSFWLAVDQPPVRAGAFAGEFQFRGSEQLRRISSSRSSCPLQTRTLASKAALRSDCATRSMRRGPPGTSCLDLRPIQWRIDPSPRSRSREPGRGDSLQPLSRKPLRLASARAF
jgi:hypothetical protein